MTKFKESDLYPPVKEYFEALGYLVFSEVKSCDVLAEKDGHQIAIELKKSFNAKLLFQAIDRQGFADEVYIALPKPKRQGGDTAKITHIAKKLNLGLIFVSLGGQIEYIDIVNYPLAAGKAKNNARRRFMVKELSGRSIDINIGGTTKQKLATAYREKCVQIAVIAYYEKEITLKLLKDKYKLDSSSGQILIKNYYGWFDRISTGHYSLSETALYEMEQGSFKRLFDLYIANYNNIMKQ